MSHKLLRQVVQNYCSLVVLAQLVEPQSILDDLVMGKQIVRFFIDEIFRLLCGQVGKHGASGVELNVRVLCMFLCVQEQGDDHAATSEINNDRKEKE